MKPLQAATVRVLDLTSGEAGETTVRILEQLGAHIHWERGAGRDLIRAAAPDIVVADSSTEEHLDTFRDRGSVAVIITSLGSAAISEQFGTPTLGTVRLDAGVPAALTGAHAAVAALGALRWARASGRGATVEISVLEVLAACLGDELPRAICPRARPTTSSGRADGGAQSTRPMVLACADGFVALSVPTAAHRQLLAGMLEASGGADADLWAAAACWARRRTKLEAFHEAQLWRIPAVPVLGADEVRRDEQSGARGTWTQAADGSGDASSTSQVKTSTMPCFAFQFAPARDAQAARAEQRVASSGGKRREAGLSEQPLPAEPFPWTHDTEASMPLSDVRVLDLGIVWAGPHCGRLLAGLGATVVKVEAPRRPDGPRPPEDWSGCWGAFGDLNRGKLSLAMDLSQPAGREALLRLSAGADVLIENFSPRVMPNLGLGPGELIAANPALITLSMPAFGSDGPWANYVSYGSGLELATGLWDKDPDGTPRPAPIPYLDYLCGVYGAAGILAGLIGRDAMGAGGRLEVAQREVACQLLAGGVPEQRGGALAIDPRALADDPSLAESGLFAPDWTSVSGRLVAIKSADSALSAANASAVGGQQGDDASRARPTRTDGSACWHLARLPWRMYDVPSLSESPAPALGQHSAQVLQSLGGYEPQAIQQLIREGVVLDSAEHESPR